MFGVAVTEGGGATDIALDARAWFVIFRLRSSIREL